MIETGGRLIAVIAPPVSIHRVYMTPFYAARHSKWVSFIWSSTSFDKFILAVESRDLSQADKSMK